MRDYASTGTTFVPGADVPDPVVPERDHFQGGKRRGGWLLISTNVQPMAGPRVVGMMLIVWTWEWEDRE